MTGVDWLIAGAVLLSVVLAASQGFLFEVFSLAGVVLGYLVAVWEYHRVGLWYAPYVKMEGIANGTGFVTIFIGLVLLAGIVGRIARWGAAAAGLRWFDRVLGGVFGLLRGCLMVAVLLLAATSWGSGKGWLARSQLAPYLLVVARTAVWVAPAQVRAQFREGLKQIQDLRVPRPAQPGTP